MRPDRIVMAQPAFDDDLSFSEGVEDLAIEQLIAKAGVEALDVAVLPRTAPLDIGSLGADPVAERRAFGPCSTGLPAMACASFWSRASTGLRVTSVCRSLGTTICAHSG